MKNCFKDWSQSTLFPPDRFTDEVAYSLPLLKSQQFKGMVDEYRVKSGIFGQTANSDSHLVCFIVQLLE